MARLGNIVSRFEIGEIWDIVEVLFKEDWNQRCKLFDAPSKSVMVYGTEIWGWEDAKVIKKVQEKYVRWVLTQDA